MERDIGVAVDSLEDVSKTIDKVNKVDVDPLEEEISSAHDLVITEEEKIKDKARKECKEKLTDEEDTLKELQLRLKEVGKECARIEKVAR